MSDTIPPKPSIYAGWFEPESAANTNFQPDYRYNNITQTPRGHSFEMDDTVGRERVRLSHRSGTFIEMHPNGDEVHKVYGDGYEITIQDKNVLIQGDCNITIEGDCNMHVMGDKVETVEGNYELHVMGNYSLVTDQTTSITSQSDMEIVAGGLATGALSISAGDAVMVNADLSVNGEITADKITSYGRIDATLGMSAGPYGFVTTEGGIAVGIPVAIPGSINAAGPIDSLASMSAPSATFGISGSVLNYDVVNELMRKVHTHANGNNGSPTTPPITGTEVSG
jgi:hypothetical protein